MNTVIVLLALALIVSNLAWWLHVRHLSGITSDLKDVRDDVNNAAGRMKVAAAQVTTAAQAIVKT